MSLPKHHTPPYQEWLQAINDSLDQEVEESRYHLPEIQKIFNLIEQNLVSPQERARMKDEYALELVKQHEYEQGRETEKRHLACKLLNQGLEVQWIAELTGLTVEAIQQLERS